jgi:hypothetical protein
MRESHWPTQNVKRSDRITIYDTSGPFTDPNIEIDIRKGLPRIREQWILDRNDVEELSEISSDYGKQTTMTKAESPLWYTQTDAC